ERKKEIEEYHQSLPKDFIWDLDEQIVPFLGIIKAKVLPPRDIRIPVLFIHVDKRLIFPNCRRCAEEDNVREECQHSDDDRAFVGTFTHAELLHAQKRNYSVIEYYEAWTWSEWSTDAYKPFVRALLKMKVEAADWPANIITDAQKENFIRRCKEEFGLDIDPSNMRKSAAK
ncbi:hypothetical protein PMAYCL1PPCAC_31576, partial [Pristionchus mayeri]